MNFDPIAAATTAVVLLTIALLYCCAYVVIRHLWMPFRIAAAIVGITALCLAAGVLCA